jgi:hypothetical protein
MLMALGCYAIKPINAHLTVSPHGLMRRGINVMHEAARLRADRTYRREAEERQI